MFSTCANMLESCCHVLLSYDISQQYKTQLVRSAIQLSRIELQSGCIKSALQVHCNAARIHSTTVQLYVQLDRTQSLHYIHALYLLTLVVVALPLSDAQQRHAAVSEHPSQRSCCTGHSFCSQYSAAAALGMHGHHSHHTVCQCDAPLLTVCQQLVCLHGSAAASAACGYGHA
jgi:hypothetical protein